MLCPPIGSGVQFNLGQVLLTVSLSFSSPILSALCPSVSLFLSHELTTCLELSRQVREMFPQTTLLCLPFFMENMLGFRAAIKATSAFQQPLGPDKKIPWMASDDAGKVAAGEKAATFATASRV